jgi:parvulin-like peptidyl-prolyl isomerase
MKRFTTSFVLLLAAASLLTVRAADEKASTPSKPVIKVSDLFTNSIVAKGKGFSISRSQLDEALISIKTGAAARGQVISPEKMSELEIQILQTLIRVQLLNSMATDADKAAGKEQTEKRVAELKTRAGSEEIFEKQLQSIGVTPAELRTRMGEELTAEVVLKRELKANATDEEVKKFYDENPAQFEQPETVRAAHVLISTRDDASGTDLSDEQKTAKKKIAEDVLKRAKAGEDFAKLAKEYSDDPGSKEKGGEYTFPRGQMVREFEAAAFSLNTNQVSDLVTTQFGYHIIKLYEKNSAKKVEFDKVKENIKEYLIGQSVQKQLPDYMAKAEKEANVQILDEKLKPAPAPKEPFGLNLK